MGTLLFFAIVCSLAWYYGGMNLAILVAVLLLLLLAGQVSQQRMQRETSPQDRARHRSDGDGHVYYQLGGRTIHESDGCAGCMANRAEELSRQGYTVEHIVGRHNSGELV